MNHVHLTSPDVAKSLAFYERHFGYTKTFDHGEGVFLSDSSGFLIAIDPAEDGARVEFPSWFHLGVCLPAPEPVHELYVAMKAEGVEFARELKEFGDDAVNFYCYDPGGFKIEVSWNREDSE